MNSMESEFKFNSVMLIDDSELDNFINRKTIENNRFSKNIYVHSSAVSSLEFLEGMGSPAPGAIPEVIFVDLNMPMMNGFEFIETYLRKFPRQKTTQLAILTSSSSPDDMQKAKALSSEILFLNKPLTAETLTRIN